MATLQVYGMDGNKVSDLEVMDSVYGIEPNQQAIYDAVLLQLASRRQGTHDVKNRSEVSGGGKKPWRQKGTGRARQGSNRAPQWRGGGVVFGPTPRKYGFKINRKVARLALRSALSEKVAESKLNVIDNLNFETIKTKQMVELMNKFNWTKKTLFVVDLSEDVDNAMLSMRNIPNAMMLGVEELNVYDIVNADTVVLTSAAAKKVEEVWA